MANESELFFYINGRPVTRENIEKMVGNDFMEEEIALALEMINDESSQCTGCTSLLPDNKGILTMHI